MSASTQTVQPISTTSFLNTLGADTHMAYTDGAYANVTQVIADLKYLGITHVRDGISNGVDANGNPDGSALLTTYLNMAKAGIKFTFIVEPVSAAAIQTFLALVNQVEAAVPGSVTAIEGANEVNNEPITYNGVTGQAGAVASQQALYAAVKADATLANVPVDYFTGYTTGSTDPNTTTGLANFDNQHPYPQQGEAPAFWVSRAQALVNLTGSDVATAPAVYTETGYSTNQVPTDVQEKYTLDLLLDTAKEGISETYLYQLLDAYAPGSVQGDDGFGLYNYTGAAKPVATAVHNLTTLLEDTGGTAATFKPASLTYTATGLPSTGNSMVMEKSDGTYVLVVWAEPQIFNITTGVETAAAVSNVTITLPQSFASIQVFDPTLGVSAIASATNSKTVTVAVTDHPIVIELSGAVTATAGPVLTIAAPVQLANTTEVTLTGTVTDATATTVQVKDGTAVLGNATVASGKWSYTSGDLTAGSQVFSAVATDAAGNTVAATDAAFTVTAPALKIVYTSGVDTSTTTRTVGVTTPVAISSAGSDTIVLAIAEDAYLGDAQFTVSVDGVQVGGVQTATALHAAGQSQSFTLQGNFGAGAHTVAVDFLNDADAVYSNNTVAGDRNLYVDQITGDGVTTVFNTRQNLAGTTGYKITLPAIATTTKPVLTIAAPVQLANTTEVTLTGTVTDATATTVQVKDGTAVLGNATVASGKWSYTSGNLTAGSQVFSAVATDAAGNTATATDAAFTVISPALKIVYTSGVDTSTTTRTVGVTTPVAISSAGSDTIVLAIAEDAYLGDAQFTVSVDGVQVGGVQTATALHAAGQSQSFTLQGNFGAGAHTVAVDFLNDADAVYSNNTVAGDRNLYVDQITGDGVTTVFNTRQNLAGTTGYKITLPATAVTVAKPTVVVTSQVLAQDTGTSATDDLTSNGAVTLTGTVTGATGTVVTVVDGATVLGTATIASGKWSFATTLAAGVHALHAVATDPSGNTVTTTAEPVITVDKTAPVLTIAAPVLVANTTGVTLTGTVTDAAATAVQVKDGATVLGNATVAGGKWSYTSGDLTAGSQVFSAVATDAAGNTVAATDAAFTVTAPALKIVYTSGVDTSTTTRTVGVTTPVAISSAGSDTIVLAIAEDAYLGDAQFTVSVDGVQVGGVQTATALHAAGQSQSFTLQGNFGAGAHTVAVDFLNDADAIYSNNSMAGDRNLYVDQITGDGVTTVFNTDENCAGTTSYKIMLPAVTPVVTAKAPVVTLAASPSAASGVTATLGKAVAGNTGDALTVKLVSDADFTTGSSLALANGSLVYTAGSITAANAGSDTISYAVTDNTNNLVTTETQKVTLVAPAVVTPPVVTPPVVTPPVVTPPVVTPPIVVTPPVVTPPVTTPPVVTPPVTTTTDQVLATVSTGTGTTAQEINLSSATPITGTYVPVSTSGIGTNSLVLYNWNPATQLKGFLAAQAAGTASIVGIGDSWTSGFGSAATGWTQLSYLSELSQALTQDGVASQTANFLGSQFYISNGLDDDNRLTPVGYSTTGTAYDGGYAIVAGGNSILLSGAGKGFNFQLDTPGNYNEVTLSYIDTGSGSVGLTVDGVAVGNMTFGNTGQTLTQTIKIPAGSHSDLVVKSTGANPVYIQGASFSSTTDPAVEVYNAGIGGWDSTSADTSSYGGSNLMGSSNGYGETASAAALKPSLAFIDLGTNDIALAEDTTAQTLANIEQIVATLQAAGTDVVIMIPQPFGSSAYATALPALRAGLEAYSTANNVPLIDLSATYDNSEADLEAAGLKSDLLHGDATLYADIGSKLASLLTQTIAGGASTDVAAVKAVSNAVALTASVVPAAQTVDLAAGGTATLDSAKETINAASSGTALILGTAAQAGALITGNGQSTTTLEITTGGNAVLNTADSALTVKLDVAANLTLSQMQFITADGSVGGSTLTALAGSQTLIGGAGDVLVGAAAFGDLFKGSAAALNQNVIQNFGGSDQIDVTDILASKVSGLSWTAATDGGVLKLTDGTHSTALTLVGNYTTASFGFQTDGTAGTLVTFK